MRSQLSRVALDYLARQDSTTGRAARTALAAMADAVRMAREVQQHHGLLHRQADCVRGVCADAQAVIDRWSP